MPSSSATVADCLTLVPDGKKRDVLELNLGSGELFPVKTDLYVPDFNASRIHENLLPAR